MQKTYSSLLYVCILQKAQAHFNIKTFFPSMGISTTNLRWSHDFLIVIMEIPLLVRQHICIEMARPASTTVMRHNKKTWNFVLFNSSTPSAANMRQWNGSALVKVMACCLFGANLLPEPMLAYCQLDSWEQISVKLESEFYHFHSRKCIWNCRLPKWRPFCPGGDELIQFNSLNMVKFCVMAWISSQSRGQVTVQTVVWNWNPMIWLFFF